VRYPRSTPLLLSPSLSLSLYLSIVVAYNDFILSVGCPTAGWDVELHQFGYTRYNRFLLTSLPPVPSRVYILILRLYVHALLFGHPGLDYCTGFSGAA